MSKPSDEVGHFDICKEMARRGMDIRQSTLDNISDMRLVNKKLSGLRVREHNW